MTATYYINGPLSILSKQQPNTTNPSNNNNRPPESNSQQPTKFILRCDTTKVLHFFIVGPFQTTQSDFGSLTQKFSCSIYISGLSSNASGHPI
jgi:hypothetical protein